MALPPALTGAFKKGGDVAKQVAIITSIDGDQHRFLTLVLAQKIQTMQLADLEQVWHALVKGLGTRKATDWSKAELAGLLTHVTSQLQNIINRHKNAGASASSALQIKVPDLHLDLLQQRGRIPERVLPSLQRYVRVKELLTEKYGVLEAGQVLLRIPGNEVSRPKPLVSPSHAPFVVRVSLAIIGLLLTEVVVAVILIFAVDSGSILGAMRAAAIMGGVWSGIRWKWLPQHFSWGLPVILLGIVVALVPLCAAHYVGYRSLVDSGGTPQEGLSAEEDLAHEVSLATGKDMRSPFHSYLVYRANQGHKGRNPRRVGGAAFHRQGIEMWLCWYTQLLALPLISLGIFYILSRKNSKLSDRGVAP